MAAGDHPPAQVLLAMKGHGGNPNDPAQLQWRALQLMGDADRLRERGNTARSAADRHTQLRHAARLDRQAEACRAWAREQMATATPCERCGRKGVPACAQGCPA